MTAGDRRSRRQGNVIRDYGVTITVAVAVALLIRFFVVEAYRIPTSAMRPTLEPGDTIFVSKVGYGFRLPGMDQPLVEPEQPRRGELVLFTQSTPEGNRDYIKRVIGIPGDTVLVTRGKVVLNGNPLKAQIAEGFCGTESLPEGKTYGVCWEPPLLEDMAALKVPAGSIFVLGDTRAIPPGTEAGKRPLGTGLVSISSLKGRANWIWLSLDSRSSPSLFPKFRMDRMFRRID